MYDLKKYKFGEVLKTVRKAKDITVEALADEIGKAPPTIYKYERNEIVPDLYTILEICNVLEVDFNDFVDKENLEVEKVLSQNPFETDTLYLYYIGFDDMLVFALEIQDENGFKKVYFKNRDNGKIYYVGILETSHDIGFITMKNYVAVNKRFEKVLITVNLKYSSDERYMATICATNDDVNLPVFKKCILSKNLITTKNDITQTYERLKITEEELKECKEKHTMTIHLDNKTDYEVMGIKSGKLK